MIGGSRYRDAFIRVAPDCPAKTGIVPVQRGPAKSAVVLEYELLHRLPYALDHAELIFRVHAQRCGLSDEDLAAREPDVRAALFARPQPCMRASMLPKKYGWGVHFDGAGNIALHAVDSAAYAQFTRSGNPDVRVLTALRSKRA